jgi:hypothetical protein
MTRRFWIYSVTAASIAMALITRPDSSASLVAPVDRSGTPTRANASQPPTSSRQLPVELVRNALTAAKEDPFVSDAPPAPVAIALPPPKREVPPPSPPPLDLKFVGRMTAPDGSQTLLAMSGEVVLSLIVGQTLTNGYRVSSVNENFVDLSYLPLNFNTRFDLPTAPKHEIR